ncbi:hypothetical protein [Candidatus Rhabdochlamydia sp. T3358]|uniref:hypothetical protein n=1 Tax=Candidatus Rhabdochlamydia sp. T3358 TaxID=2099795 RepID=UPI0010AFC2AE|nr:hypothetical protein [Candidatus Rhabdochlamydia sp. T3358]VHO00771.1 hypothetical protein RHT_00172 [Candidatus Rhabdochlamydia sp. T3358]
MGGVFAAGQKAFDKAFSLMDSVLRDTLPRVNQTLGNANQTLENSNQTLGNANQTLNNSNQTLENANQTLRNTNELISDFKGIPGNLTETVKGVGAVTKMGMGIAGLKFCSDMGVSWYRAIKLTGIASNARNDLKKLVDNTTKTEAEIVNVLKNTSGDLKSSVGQLTEDAHKMSQNFGQMTESLSQSSTEISGAANQASRNFGYMTHITSDFLAYLSQDIHQTSRCFRITCFSLTTSALAATMTYLQNSSCDRDPESMLCTAPLKSMAATTIAAGLIAMTMLMPNRVQVHQNNKVLASNETTSIMDHPASIQLEETMKLNFFIPEEGVDQNIEWTQEELDSIKATNIDVLNLIEAKRKFKCCKWTKQELTWLLNQNENLFFNMILSMVYTASDCLDNN